MNIETTDGKSRAGGPGPAACELTCPRRATRFVAAYAVHPLFGGGVAEWLKAAVC